MFIQAQVRQSSIGGSGLFALQPIRRGTIICFFAEGGKIITEDQYVAGLSSGDHDITRTGTRWAGQYFVYGGEPSPTHFINHSFDPNLLAHCGTFIARRDLAEGDELTVDYRYLLDTDVAIKTGKVDTTDVGLYHDSATGQEIRGFGPRESLLRSTRELLGILESCEDWTG